MRSRSGRSFDRARARCPQRLPASCGRQVLILLAALAAGCGSGGASEGGWIEGLFLPKEQFAAQCAVPRSGVNPATGQPYPDVQGSTLSENYWLRSWSHELYLWYDEIMDRDPAAHSTPEYFSLMKTFATTPSGAPKDRFHHSIPTEEWVALSQSGVASGYGAAWSIISASPPREIIVAYVQPGSPAEEAGIDRGARVVGVDGVDAVHGTGPAIAAVINEGLFPSEPGQAHELELLDLGGETSRVVVLESTQVENVPVQNVDVLEHAGLRVGYILFNEHIATAEAGLIQAVEWLREHAVHELVLDVRYNGGGFLAIANQLAYMIAGDAATAGRIFERLTFNDKHPATNPVTGAPLEPVPFIGHSLGLSSPRGMPLPTLDLPRVAVLTGRGTCSASESIINSLRGVGVEVVQVGVTTCGKPYGSYPADNCGTTYFSIQFKGVNDAGFGDYAEGFLPANAPGGHGVRLAGCWVADDFEHALGDVREQRLAAALQYLDSGRCPAGGAGSAAGAAKPAMAGGFPPTEGVVRKGAWLENRILDHLWE